MPAPTFIPTTLPTPRRRRHNPPHCRVTPPKLTSLQTLQTHLQTHLHTLNRRTDSIKCPFWRRRFADTLEALQQILTFLQTRHKSLPLPPPPSYHTYTVTPKSPHLPLHERLELIRDDFRIRQYYITGRLTKHIYRDDCLFDGPDPDVPVRGLRKYVAASAGLFVRGVSRVDLIDIRVVDGMIRAEWRLEGALKLPWRPRIKPFTGVTLYQFDDDGLVESHVEEWSVSALDAFVSVLWKDFGAPPAKSLDEIRGERLES